MIYQVEFWPAVEEPIYTPTSVSLMKLQVGIEPQIYHDLALLNLGILQQHASFPGIVQ